MSQITNTRKCWKFFLSFLLLKTIDFTFCSYSIAIGSIYYCRQMDAGVLHFQKNHPPDHQFDDD